MGVGGQGFCDGGDLGELAGGEPGFGVLVGAEGAVDAAGLGGGQILGTPAKAVPEFGRGRRTGGYLFFGSGVLRGADRYSALHGYRVGDRAYTQDWHAIAATCSPGCKLQQQDRLAVQFGKADGLLAVDRR